MNDGKIHILLVEEDISDARLIEGLLDKVPKREYSVRHVHTFDEGVGQLGIHPFDVVIVDLDLSDKRGLETLVAIQTQAKDRAVIMLASADNEDAALKALDLSIQDYLVKSELSSNLLSRSICCAIQRKKCAEKLEESEQRFRSTFNQAAVGIAHMGRDGNLLRINQKYCDILGYTTAEMEVMTLRDITHPDDKESSWQHFQELLNGEISSYVIEKRYIRKDGSTIWVKLTASLSSKEDGNGAFTIAVVEDITSHKKAEEALHLSQARFEALYRDNPAMIIILNNDGIMLSVNTMCERQLGYTLEELEGRSGLELFLEDDRSAVADQLQKCLQNPYQVYSWQFHKVRKDGEVLWVEEQAQAVNDLTGNLTILVVCQDITDRKRAEEALQEALNDLGRSNKDLEQFAYLASHDLKEPLRMVHSYLQLLDRKYHGRLDEKADTYLHYAVGGAKRMDSLIEGILNYSKIKVSDFDWVDTKVTVADAIANLATIIHDNHGEIVSDQLPVVWGDATLLLQLFQNLISNALKYIKPGVPPRIVISVNKLEHEWLFSVKDNGIGIESKDFERIFQIFQRLHVQEEYAGTGIGLASCKRIVEQHQGRIWLDSSPGEGTIFFFTIPLSPPGIE